MIAAGLTSVHSASQGHWRPLKVLGILNEFPQVPVPGGVQVQLGDAYGDEPCYGCRRGGSRLDAHGDR